METESITSTKNSVVGTSEHGKLEEALADAIRIAQRQTPGTDRIIMWKIEEIYGESGGFVGINNLSVKIDVQVR